VSVEQIFFALRYWTYLLHYVLLLLQIWYQKLLQLGRLRRANIQSRLDPLPDILSEALVAFADILDMHCHRQLHSP